MKRVSYINYVLLVLISPLMFSSLVLAQATRTWVSGVGDDANPCSRTAPCKTFAGAISKTATSGEINVLDPGGFGGVTITKSITISSEGTEAGVLVSGTNAIIINSANAFVTLRGLDIEGLGTGLSGIKILNAATVHVENCTINNFTSHGIEAGSSGALSLFVKDTTIRNNRGASSAAIFISPVGGTSLVGTFDNVKILRNKRGIVVNQLASITLRDSLISGSGANALTIISASTSAVANIVDSVIANNGGTAISSEGVGAQASLSNATIYGNAVALASVSGGQVVSFGNNTIFGNGMNGTPTATITQK